MQACGIKTTNLTPGNIVDLDAANLHCTTCTVPEQTGQLFLYYGAQNVLPQSDIAAHPAILESTY